MFVAVGRIKSWYFVVNISDPKSSRNQQVSYEDMHTWNCDMDQTYVIVLVFLVSHKITISRDINVKTIQFYNNMSKLTNFEITFNGHNHLTQPTKVLQFLWRYEWFDKI